MKEGSKMKQYFGFIVLVSLLAVMTGCSSGGDDNGGGGTPAAICDTTHLSLCTTESSCVSASGNWYNDSCHSDPSSTWDVMEWDKGQWK